ncbi:MAG: 6-hydroxymethylpterin diphosphokinase MptE-like protein [Clostridiaceae bacterium]|nr:6-hydroxymethylpterin diphosphokinase MptE-like protein [Clostridiaceae bacterium]
MKIAKSDETQAMYQKNLELLPQWLKDTVSGVSEEALGERTEITYNSEGLPVCIYKRDGAVFHITSGHPIKESEMWVSSLHLEDSSLAFLYGCGFGYPLFELFAKKPPQAVVVVFERDVCLFKAMLYYFDLSPLFETQKIIFYVGDSACFGKLFSETFCSRLFFVATYPTILFTFSAARHFKQEYLEIHRYIFGKLTFVMSCVGNSHQDDMLGMRNLFANLKEIVRSPYLSSMKDKFRGVTAVIVSNGPSLDKSIPLLKKIQGKCLMICAESAIVPLTKRGIKPDILCVLERSKIDYVYHFKDHRYPADIALFTLVVADPRILPSFEGEKLPIFRMGEGINRWVNSMIGDGSALDAGTSVAHLAAGSAIHLGADPIIFVGQDLSYSSDGATHSKDAVISQDVGKPERDFFHALPTVMVEGNDGTMLPSNFLWAHFRTGIETIISNCPEHHFYNATEGGAKIKGAGREKFSKLIEQYCTEPLPHRVNELLAEERKKISVEERGEMLEKLTADIKRYAVMFRNLARKMNLKRLESERMLRLCVDQDEKKYMEIFDEVYRRNLLFFYQCLSDGLSCFFFQRVYCAYFYLMDQLGAIDSRKKRMQIFDLHRQFFRDLGVVSGSVAVALEKTALEAESLPEEDGKAV